MVDSEEKFGLILFPSIILKFHRFDPVLDINYHPVPVKYLEISVD